MIRTDCAAHSAPAASMTIMRQKQPHLSADQAMRHHLGVTGAEK
jgi:hypothetical protein